MQLTKSKSETPKELTVTERLEEQALLFTPHQLNTSRQMKLSGRKIDAKKLLIPGYVFNSFNNRRTRRMDAKRAGYFNPQSRGWHMYRATDNKQTLKVKEAVS